MLQQLRPVPVPGEADPPDDIQGLRRRALANLRQRNVRDWLYVEDHCRGILAALEKGKVGEAYNLGGHNEKSNIEIAKIILKELEKPKSLIAFVADRPGHDLRCAIDSGKANKELGWCPAISFEEGIKKTIAWYRSEHGKRWLDECVESAQDWLKENYKNRN